ncbi:hypothetical protein NE236_04620 [Actinoallomurus purpureus]|uniref:hypothetical protein n=1 Tax=Actinoallomurus purpureus TaxID=478114 RepID=UPI0020925E3C|nr:hypothetical protein [Actinoallomurus purpureus]MCO6004256.1 hypothetical protein [Actinoallomurus purpureus]
MEDRLLVGGLRSGDPGAIGAVYDAYADRLYDYCWFQLRNRETAQLALRDALLGAEAHIGELRAPERFGLWLYALTRIECRRRRPPGVLHPDLAVARHDQDDVDLRVIAWRAVTGLPALSQELLDLRHRHALTPAHIAGVVGLPAREVTDLLHQASALLEAAVLAEILAHDDPFECDGRAAILRNRCGELGDDLREALVCHGMECGVCAAHLPRTISTAKVCALLPHATPPDSLRQQVTSCFTDPRLAGYRLFAAARLRGFGARGFPAQQGPGRSRTPARDSRWPRGLIAVTGAVFTAVSAVTVCQWLSQDTHRTHVAGGTVPAPRARVPSPGLIGAPAVGRPVSATFPLGPRDRAVAPSALDGARPKALDPAHGDGRLDVAPGRLVLGPGDSGTITLRAVGGPVRWQAAVTGAATVSPAGGSLDRGETATVSVQAPDDGPGGAVIVFWPTGARVAVDWSGPASRPPHSSPPPTGTPPTDTPPASPPTSTPAPPPSAPPPSAPAPPPSTRPPLSRSPEPPSTTPPSAHSDPPEPRPVPEGHPGPARHPAPSAEGTG